MMMIAVEKSRLALALRALLLGLLLTDCVVLSQGKTLTSIQGSAIISSIEYRGNVHVSTLIVRLGPDSVVKTEGATEEMLEGVYSGQRINVTGYLNSTGSGFGNPPVIEVVSIEPLEVLPASMPTVSVLSDPSMRVDGQSIVSGLPVTLYSPLMSKFKVLIIPILALDQWGNACPGVQPFPYGKGELGHVLWGAAQYTLDGFYKECSKGRTIIDRDNSLITDFVRLPCSGYTAFGPFQIPGCTDNDARGWQENADAAVARMGIDINKYDFIIYLGPPTNVQCAWLAMADYGCAANSNNYKCRTWAHGTGWDSLAMYMHELGHHFFLMHAGQVVNGALVEYADTSCTMGYCCALRCFNAPHAYQMGWLPVIEIDQRILTAGSTISMVLQPQTAPQGRGVRVTPNWAFGSVPFFFSYRAPVGYEKDLSYFPDYNSRINIYSSPIQDPRGGGPTTWLAGIGDGAPVYGDAATGLTFRFIGREGTGARVSVCRFGGQENLRSCCYGRDNDCNGVGGKNDPACAQFMPQCPYFRFNWGLGTTNPNPFTPDRTQLNRRSVEGGNSTQAQPAGSTGNAGLAAVTAIPN